MKTHATILALSLAAAVTLGCSSSDEQKIDLPDKVEPAGAPEATDQPTDVIPKNRQVARLSGTLEPVNSGSVAANVNGLIREVYVEEGDRVEKGDKLVNIDSADYRLRVRQADAALANARAQRDTLNVEYERTKQLLERDAVARSAFDQLSGQLAAANAGVDQADVALDMARKAQRDALIRAPFAGVVTEVQATPGAYAAAGPAPLVSIEGIDVLELRIAVPETYAGRLKKGSKLEMSIPATGHEETVAITRINPVVDRMTRSFDVIATIEKPGEKVLPGMFAEVTLDLEVNDETR